MDQLTTIAELASRGGAVVLCAIVWWELRGQRSELAGIRSALVRLLERDRERAVREQIREEISDVHPRVELEPSLDPSEAPTPVEVPIPRQHPRPHSQPYSYVVRPVPAKKGT